MAVTIKGRRLKRVWENVRVGRNLGIVACSQRPRDTTIKVSFEWDGSDIRDVPVARVKFVSTAQAERLMAAYRRRRRFQ